MEGEEEGERVSRKGEQKGGGGGGQGEEEEGRGRRREGGREKKWNPCCNCVRRNRL